MKTAIATRFRCSCPLPDLFEMTLMFLTLIFQYLNKLVEGKVGDFTSPQAFHAVKVQRLKENSIKLFTKFGGKLPMKVFALIADFPIKACELSHATPPPIRPFLLTAKFFAEGSQFVQGVFQRLRVLDFLTRAKCQISVFHAEVCPNAFTCCRQRFEICVGRRYAEPVIAASVSFDGDTAESAMPLAVFVKRIRHFIQLPLARCRIPLAERQRDTIIFQRPPRFTGVGDRLKFVALFDFRSTSKFLEKSIVRFMNTFEFLLDRLTRQCLPMRVRCIFQNFYVVTHALKVDIRQPVFMPLPLPLMEILMHLPHIVKKVSNAYRVRLFTKWIFIAFHGLSRITPLTPKQWVGRHIALRQRCLCLPT